MPERRWRRGTDLTAMGCPRVTPTFRRRPSGRRARPPKRKRPRIGLSCRYQNGLPASRPGWRENDDVPGLWVHPWRQGGKLPPGRSRHNRVRGTRVPRANDQASIRMMMLCLPRAHHDEPNGQGRRRGRCSDDAPGAHRSTPGGTCLTNRCCIRSTTATDQDWRYGLGSSSP